MICRARLMLGPDRGLEVRTARVTGRYLLSPPPHDDSALAPHTDRCGADGNKQTGEKGAPVS